MGSIICKESCEAFNESIKQHKNSTSKLPWYSNVQVDWNGCRKFPRLPAPGVHPRLFFTKDEIPAILARFTHCELGATLKQCLDHCRSHFLSRVYAHIENVESGEVDNPTLRETIDQFFVTNEQRNVTMLGAYAYGVIYEDAELVEKAMRYTLFYARVILRSREIALEQDVKTKPYNVWHTNNWDVNIARLFGDTSFALLYDLMYNDLTGEEVKMFRKAITSAVSGRRGWGMGWPTRKIQSNWAAYHGDLLVLCAAVEEEEGFDREVFAVFSDLMAHYLDYAFYDSGHPIEDSYVLNLGFREGSICFLVMARRGHNIFNHPRMLLSACSLNVDQYSF